LRTASNSACFARYLVGSGEAIRPGGFTIPLAAFPPFEVVATFGVDLILTLDVHMIAANPTLTVEKRRNEGPVCASRGGNLDFLEEFDAGDLWHLAVPRLNRHHIRLHGF